MSNQLLGYYGCDTSFPLIKDIAETFGANLENMSTVDRHLLVYCLAQQIWDITANAHESEEAFEIKERHNELDYEQKNCLILALANKNQSQPLRYWGCDKSNSLINDIYETFGDGLDGLEDSDRFWIIARLSGENWTYAEGPTSDEAAKAVERLEELSIDQLENLLIALVNS
jgi:hypothetical protein